MFRRCKFALEMRFGVLASMYIRIRLLLADDVVLSVERRLSNSAACAVEAWNFVNFDARDSELSGLVPTNRNESTWLASRLLTLLPFSCSCAGSFQLSQALSFIT